MTTLRGSTRHGTKGRWRTGGATHSSPMSASTTLAAAAKFAATPVWWKARTVSSAQSERTSTPPSPTCPTMSASRHASWAATRRSAARSTWRFPGKTVRRVDRSTGLQSVGSAQSHTTSRAKSAICSCEMVTVGTASGCLPSRSATPAASALCIHGSTSRS